MVSLRVMISNSYKSGGSSYIIFLIDIMSEAHTCILDIYPSVSALYVFKGAVLIMRLLRPPLKLYLMGGVSHDGAN